jgi:hypothetical protein
MHDARTLRVEGTMGWGEVLVGVEHSEAPDEIGLLASVGIDPRLIPPSGGNGPQGRPGLAQRWRATVRLSASLAHRLVRDLAPPDKTSAQRQAWDNWANPRGPNE